MFKRVLSMLEGLNAMSLALGVIIGGAIGKVVGSLTSDVLMPLISLVIPGGSWRTAEIALSRDAAGQVVNAIKLGTFLYHGGKMAKSNVDVRHLDRGKVEKTSGDKVKQVIKVKVGIEQELGKKIARLLKDSKLKVQAAIQGDVVRVQDRGLPNLRSKRRGELVAMLMIHVPKKVTERQRQLLEEYAKTEKVDVRKSHEGGFWQKMKDLKDSLTGT